MTCSLARMDLGTARNSSWRIAKSPSTTALSSVPAKAAHEFTPIWLPTVMPCMRVVCPSVNFTIRSLVSAFACSGLAATPILLRNARELRKCRQSSRARSKNSHQPKMTKAWCYVSRSIRPLWLAEQESACSPALARAAGHCRA